MHSEFLVQTFLSGYGFLYGRGASPESQSLIGVCRRLKRTLIEIKLEIKEVEIIDELLAASLLNDSTIRSRQVDLAMAAL